MSPFGCLVGWEKKECMLMDRNTSQASWIKLALAWGDLLYSLHPSECAAAKPHMLLKWSINSSQYVYIKNSAQGWINAVILHYFFVIFVVVIIIIIPTQFLFAFYLFLSHKGRYFLSPSFSSSAILAYFASTLACHSSTVIPPQSLPHHAGISSPKSCVNAGTSNSFPFACNSAFFQFFL